MTKHYFLLLACMPFAATATGQTVNQGNNAPVIGESFTVHSLASTVSGPSGASQTWNFSTLQSGTMSSSTVQNPSSIPEGSNFPGATIASVSGPGTAYMKVTSTGVETMGVSTPGFNMIYQNSEKILGYPCSYNTAWSDPWSTNFNISGFDMSRSGTTTGLADGYGTLVMPYGTVTNVLRVKLTQSFSDISSGVPVASYSTTSYYYYKPGIHMALVSSSTVISTPVGSSPQTTESMAWLDGSNVGIDEALRNAIGIDLMPNPAKGEVTLAFGNGGGHNNIELVDANGGLVKQEQLNTAPGITRHTMDLDGVAPGLYVLRIIGANGEQGAKRLVVE